VSPGARRRAAAALLGAAFLLLTGCASLSTTPAPVARRLPAGRTLIIARVPLDENRPIADSAEDLLLRALRGGGADVMSGRQLVAESAAAGLGLLGPRLIERVRQGGAPLAEDGPVVLEQLHIGAVVVVEVSTYEQVWARSAKFTRVGLDTHAVSVASRELLWRVGTVTEVDDRPGRAFQYAMEQAVDEVAGAIQPRPADWSPGSLWRQWRR
jgi:hypothetical protein